MTQAASSRSSAGLRSGTVAANGLELFYEDRGPVDAEPIVLIMGLGTQMIAWPEAFCAALAAAGLRVIRFDNRDVGLSTKMKGLGRYDDVRVAVLKSLAGWRIKAPYRLDDMAADTVGLLDALGIGRAHLVGASMGGMIGQVVAARYPERTASLTSIMSTSGVRGLPRASMKVSKRLVSRPKSRRREDMVSHLVTTMQMIGSPGIQYSRAQWTKEIRTSVERCHYPAGVARQLVAILGSGGRVKLLREIAAPTLVIHGDADPLLPLAHGRHTALWIPGARLEVMRGMGHDLPPPLQAELAAMIAAHAQPP